MRRPWQQTAEAYAPRDTQPFCCVCAVCFWLRPLQRTRDLRTTRRFREQYLRASKLYGAKDYASAIPALQAAYAIQPPPQLLYNIGQAFRRLRQWASARVYFEMYSALARDLSLKDRQALQGTLDEVRSLELAERKPEVEVIEKTRTLVIQEEKPLPRWLRPLGITAGALGLGMATTGAVFLGLDGLCTQPAVPPATQCTTVYNSQTPGIALTAAGAGMLALGLVTFGLSFRKPSRTQKPVEKEGSLELQILLLAAPVADEPPPSGFLPDGSPGGTSAGRLGGRRQAAERVKPAHAWPRGLARILLFLAFRWVPDLWLVADAEFRFLQRPREFGMWIHRVRHSHFHVHAEGVLTFAWSAIAKGTPDRA